MMGVVRANLNLGLLCKSCIQHDERSFYWQFGLKIEESTTIMLYLGHIFIWYWNLDASGGRSETPGKFLKCGAGEGWRSVEPIMW